MPMGVGELDGDLHVSARGRIPTPQMALHFFAL